MSDADKDYCTCLNQQCCGGSNKCNKNRSTCTSCGINCVETSEIMPWNQDVMEENTCYEDFDFDSQSDFCAWSCSSDLGFDQQE
ncbi:hypothetical protein ACHAXA_007118 [Cyclostephanos tholiformis]|uniref:Uncharacterized protein n=1 Tax=Cyclostephanos tholiformis TaxID=382380 RepID=A0ABD3RYG6_9STRA